MTLLAGKRILVTRPHAQAADLCDKLIAHGAKPILFPTIEIAPMDDYTGLDQAITVLDQYQWMVFTSVNGVAAFWKRLELVGGDHHVLSGIKIAAIGPATAQALEARGVRAESIPEEYVAEALAAEIGDVSGQFTGPCRLHRIRAASPSCGAAWRRSPSRVLRPCATSSRCSAAGPNT